MSVADQSAGSVRNSDAVRQEVSAAGAGVQHPVAAAAAAIDSADGPQQLLPCFVRSSARAYAVETSCLTASLFLTTLPAL